MHPSSVKPASVVRLVSLPLRSYAQLSYALSMPGLPLAKCDEILDAMLRIGGASGAAQILKHSRWKKSSSPKRSLAIFLDALLEDDTLVSLLTVVRHLEPSDDPGGYRRRAVDLIAKVHASAVRALEWSWRLKRDEAETLVCSAVLAKPMNQKRAEAILAANARFGYELLDEDRWLSLLAYADDARNHDVLGLFALGRREYAFGSLEYSSERPLPPLERVHLLSRIAGYYDSVACYLLCPFLRAESDSRLDPKLRPSEIRLLAGPTVEYLERHEKKHPDSVNGLAMTQKVIKSRRVWGYFSQSEQARLIEVAHRYFETAGLSDAP